MTDLVYLSIAVIVGAASLLEMWKRFSAHEARVVRAFHKSSVTPVASARNGLTARFTGTVVSEHASRIAPLSQIPCVGYRIQFTRIGSRHTSEPTVSLHEETALDRFELQDETGTAWVRPDDGKVVLLGLARIARFTYRELPERARAILERRGFDRREVGGEHVTIECAEVVLVRGDRVAIGGMALWESDAPAHAESAGAVFRQLRRTVTIRAGGHGLLVVERIGG